MGAMKRSWMNKRILVVWMAVASMVVSVGCGMPMSSLHALLARQLQTTASGLMATIFPLSDSDEPDEPDAGESADEDSEPDEKAEDLVVDWQKPVFALFVTGRQHGYIEPCGCTGLENQKGGLMRRHSAQKILLGRGWDLVSIDAGNMVRRFGQQPTIKLRKTFHSLCRIMNYDVVGLGPDDLKIPSIDLAQAVLDAPQTDNPFTCANVIVEDESLTNLFRVIQKNGRKIGVTMVVGEEHLPDLKRSEGLKITTPADGLQNVVQKLRAANCDMNVLVAHAPLDECRELAKQFPVFDLLITAGGAGDPTLQPETIEAGGHATSMIQVGVKGMYVGIVGYYEKDGKRSIAYKRVPLDDRFEDSPEMKTMFTSYQQELKGLWLANALEDIKPRLHPSGNRFVGSESCADCHDEEYEIWAEGIDTAGGPHENATRSLTHPPNSRSWVPRHFDPECVSCHVTGWNPQKYYPYESGWMDAQRDALLHGNGCENCHGPGSAHVAAENGETDDDDAAIDRLRQQMVVTLEEARDNMCMKCHDLDNSPDFVQEGGFEEYWPHIKHGGE